jgi:hypothetical protein
LLGVVSRIERIIRENDPDFVGFGHGQRDQVTSPLIGRAGNTYIGLSIDASPQRVSFELGFYHPFVAEPGEIIALAEDVKSDLEKIGAFQVGEIISVDDSATLNFETSNTSEYFRDDGTNLPVIGDTELRSGAPLSHDVGQELLEEVRTALGTRRRFIRGRTVYFITVTRDIPRRNPAYEDQVDYTVFVALPETIASGYQRLLDQLEIQGELYDYLFDNLYPEATLQVAVGEDSRLDDEEEEMVEDVMSYFSSYNGSLPMKFYVFEHHDDRGRVLVFPIELL